MNQSGDGHGQPGESVDSLSDIANLMEGDDTPEQEETLEESEEDEPADDSEVDEDDAGDEEAPEAEDDDEEITLKHEGKEVRVKKSEAIELAQKGLDYTRKTMAVAEERKAAEAERAAAAEVRQHHEQITNEAAGRLDALIQFYEAQVGDPPPIEWASQDANYYLVQKEQHEARKGQLQSALQARQQLHEQQARMRQAWLMEEADKTEKALRDTLPGWSDNTLNDLAGYAAKLGLNPQTVDVAFVQKGFWEALHKAQQYDELLARKATLKPKAELPRVSKPSATKQTPRGIVAKQEAEKAYRAKPSLNTLADLI